MTKKPSHLHSAEPSEPRELGPEPADTTGKEIEPVRDWDQDSIVRAIKSNQSDLSTVIEDELAWLLRLPAWQQPAKKAFAYTFTRDDDVVEKALAMCRLDNIPVHYHDDDNES